MVARSSGTTAAGRGWSLACGIILLAGLSIFFFEPEGEADVGAVVKHFAHSSFDFRCSIDGRHLEAGLPCADSRGYRFVLRPQGAFDIYLTGDGRRVLSSSGGRLIWSGDKNLDMALTAAFEKDIPVP